MAKPKLSAAVRSVGPVASKPEVARIAQDTGKSVAQVMSKAIDAGVSLGSGAVNAYNKGSLGSGSSPLSIMPAQVAQNLAALSGLQMNPGTVYAGSSATVTPGTVGTKFNGSASSPATTTYNPIVLPRSLVSGVTSAVRSGAGAGPYDGAMNPGAGNDQGPPPPPGGANPGGATGNWWDSITEGINGILTSITDQINANNANQGLYMGEIQGLIQQMSAANAQQPTFAPYAMTTTTSSPVQGAQVTQAIGRKLKNLNTSLAIAPAETASAGTGLNIAI